MSCTVTRFTRTSLSFVTVIRQYLHPGKVLSGSQGDVETLPNGNRVVGWGAGALVSEFTGAGHRVFDLRFPAPLETYRAYRLPWTGHPADNPAVAAKAGSGGTLNVYASWNGATQVARWQVLTGSSANALAPAASAAWNGLETTIPVKNAGPYVAVQALGADGTVLGTSPAITH